MINRQSIKIYCLLAVSLIVSIGLSQDKWGSISDFRDVRDMHYQDNTIWAATSGGLVGLNLDDLEFVKYTPEDGLGGTGILSMISDGSGGLWLAFENGSLQIFQIGHGVTRDVLGFDFESGITRVNSMDISAHGLFLATNRGIARVTYTEEFDRWVWFEEYTQLGEFPTNQPVISIKVVGDYIWAGTEIGIARGDLNSPSPLSWDNYTTDNGLYSNEILDINYFEDKVLVVTPSGVNRWENNNWRSFSPATDLKRLLIVNDLLRAVKSRGAYTWDGSGWEINTPFRNHLSSAVWDDDNRVWLGMKFDNLAAYRGGIVVAEDSTFTEYIPNGAATRYALDFSFTDKGEVLMVGGYGAGQFGLSLWNGNKWDIWTVPDFRDLTFTMQTRIVEADMDGGIWVGSWGGGLAYYSPEKSIIHYGYSKETGYRLIGYDASKPERTILIPDIATDSRGNVWLVNRAAINDSILVCIPHSFVKNHDPAEDWVYFPLDVFSRYPHFDRIAIDSEDRIWFGSNSVETAESQGIYCFDYNGTLDDKSDDRILGPFSGLSSPQVLDLTWDDAGYIWAGSLDGAYYLNTNVQGLENQIFISLYPLRDHQVNEVTIDPTGNKWFATTVGVKIVAPDLFTLKRHITMDSPDRLPSLNIFSLGINPATGIAYIGTDKGTVTLDTPYRDYGEVIASISIEPNPFNPNDGRMIFTGSSLADLAKAGIYTPDGRLVRRLNHEEAAFGWDGLTDSGHKVASGVYIIVAHTDAGESERGKVAVVWE